MIEAWQQPIVGFHRLLIISGRPLAFDSVNIAAAASIISNATLPSCVSGIVVQHKEIQRCEIFCFPVLIMRDSRLQYSDHTVYHVHPAKNKSNSTPSQQNFHGYNVHFFKLYEGCSLWCRYVLLYSVSNVISETFISMRLNTKCYNPNCQKVVEHVLNMMPVFISIS